MMGIDDAALRQGLEATQAALQGRRRIVAADLFCGAGGTSTGLVRACRRFGLGDPALVAVNHWDKAVSAHRANHPWAQAQRAKEKESALPAPTGRKTIEGDVIKVEWKDDDFGGRNVMIVKTSEGWMAWGTAPGMVKKGDRINLKATFTPSDKDPKFAFFKRPIVAVLSSTQKDQ